MTNPKSRIFAAVAGTLIVGATAAWAVEPSQDAKIQELEQKVAALETKQAQNSKDLATTIDGVLRDAQQRSQFLATNGDAAAGYDNGFFIRSGEWSLRPGAWFQFRNVTDYRKKVAQSPAGDKDEIDNGFEVRRLWFSLEGTAFTKDLEYSFVWDTDRDGGGVGLLDAWAKYMFSDDWGFRVGQFKDPVHHEELAGEFRQLAAEKSMVNEIIGGGFLDRTQGATLIYGGHAKNNPFSAEAGLTDGLNQDNTNFISRDGSLPPGSHSVEFGVAGRAEYKFMGDWKSYQDFSAMNNKDDLFVLGIGGDWSQAGDGNILTGTIDGQWENTQGWGVYGAVLVRHADDEIVSSLGGSGDKTDWGGLIQVGYMLNPEWELFGRYDATVFDDEIASAGDEDTFHELTIGLNYYLGKDGSAGHRAKVTVDLSYFPNGVPDAAFDPTTIGAQGENDGEAEFVFRGQFQLWI